MKESLNQEQKLAVEHIEGPMLVIAGAGSGKTRVVTFRIAHLLQLGVPACEILAVTFTNKAAEEMRHRIQQQAQHKILASTFHSLGARILRESSNRKDFAIYDEDDSEKLVKECLAACNQKEALVKAVRSQISHAKNNLVQPEEYGDIYNLYQSKLKEYNAVDFDDLLFLVVELFRSQKEVLEKYQRRWRFILIDEYQDTNIAQHEIIKLLSAEHHNVFAVGDPDQSIYSWRGANIQNILNFERDFPGARVIPLEQNYRSFTTILNAANALISHNPSRYEKKLWSTRGPGEKIGFFLCENEHAEADFVVQRLLKHHTQDHIPLNECVIFYRTNFQSRLFEDKLLRQRIPYVIIGGLSFYQRKEIKDILSLLRMVLGGSDFLSFARTINLPKRGLGDATLTRLELLAGEKNLSIFDLCAAIVDRNLDCKLSAKQFEGLKSYVDMIFALREMVKAKVALHTIISEAIERSRYLDVLAEDLESFQERKENLAELVSKAAESEETSLAQFLEELTLRSTADEAEHQQDTVRLMTLHNGKGLEFTAVFLVGLEEDLFPHVNAKDEIESLEEERRLCYVGMTRAKNFLYLSAAKSRFIWGTPRLMRPSRFLSEIPPEYLKPFHRTVEVHYDEESVFEEGDTVHHRDFGSGVIQKSYQTSLGLTYDVFFPDSEATRSLVAKYAKLSKS